MDMQLIRDALEASVKNVDIDVIKYLCAKALAELNTPAPQSARDVAADFLSHMELPNRKLYIISLAHEIEYYADSRVQEALEKAEIENAREYHGKPINTEALEKERAK